ncbi:RHS repeat domain-containing protein [Phytomonospora endophytica]|uniref:RHS repeat-associated protein n=1 Tax=Phytomonospora endophytica TaxID=714109 RepID=A0A841FWC9_9ACTN|nr:RHS repeat-associated core domain-containing protein [Phytomonospora endophytica]MBB6037842.1 RHS repeat-associated protein [Phytomonospora endophytica]GIG68741.1 type IV secretion protein Rhs [Phytomonospora endophytica]
MITPKPTEIIPTRGANHVQIFRRSMAAGIAAALIPVVLIATPALADGFQRSPQPFDSTPVEPVSGAGSAFSDAAPNWGGGPADAPGPSGSGDWSATDLSHAGSWTHGGASGGFSYTYAMRVPPTTGPASPMSLAYSSASHDGRTSGTNNQASWVGDGWSYSTGFVERTYAACGSEPEESGNQGDDLTGDLCWDDDSPAVTLSLAGTNTALVRDDDTGVWRAASDTNWRVRHSGAIAAPGAASTEKWTVTTPDGTTHHFAAVASSRLTVPVFGNHSGEACHKSGDFKGSRCDQAYRWLLDKSVDVHGNMTRYTYGTAKGDYGPAMSEDSTADYTRESWPTRIELGLREGSSAGPAAKVEFTTADRCLTDCRDSAGDPKQDNWPDTPWDLHCESGDGCQTHSPSFFSTKRLSAVTTYVADGAGFRKVDSWALTHEFKDYGDAEQVVLWLSGIRQTGHIGGTASMPGLEFGGMFFPNRVDRGEAWPTVWRPRLTSIRNETGGVTTINYSDPDCGPGSVPSAHEHNTRRCYPVKYTPEGLADPVETYFHKYVVTSIAEADATGGGDVVWTFYQYSTAGGGTETLWAWNDAEYVPDDDRDWNQWRGYAEVVTLTGDPADPAPQLRSRTRYYRGLDGDKLPGGQKRSVSVTDTQGDVAVDHRALAGMAWETASYDDTTVISTQTNWYWHSRTATRGYDGGKLEAFLTGIARTDSRTRLSPSKWRETRTENTYDAYGRVTAIADGGEVSVTGDERCLRTTYTDNTTAWLLASVATTESVSVACSAPVNRPTDVIGAARAYYDGHTSLKAAPTHGLITKAEALEAWNGEAVYTTVGTSTFDDLGRPLVDTDALGAATTTEYTPAGAGPLTQTKTTNAAGHVTTTRLDPAWGSITRTEAPNARDTVVTYDALGRATAVWTPDRDPATVPASKLFTYDVSQTEPSAVTTKTMIQDGSYLTEIALYDSLLRARQTQKQTSGGRIITQTVYDSYGRARYDSAGVFNNESGPTDRLMWVPRTADVARTEFAYDNAGRVTDEIFVVKGDELRRTSYRYGGHDTHWMTTTIAPQGGISTATLTDAKDRTVELRQFHDRGAAGGFDATTYAYTPDGDLSRVTDAAGNQWSFTYDIRGRQVTLDDPDTGPSSRTYNAGGQVTSTTDANNTTLTYAYDVLGRPTKVWRGPADASRPIIERTYDGAVRGVGHPHTATHWVDGQAWTTTIEKYSYDGQVQRTSTKLPAAAGPLAGTYTQSSTFYPDGKTLTTTLGAAGGLAEETLTHHYDAMGRPTKLTSNGDDEGEGHVYVDHAVYSPYGQLLQRRLGDPDEVGGTSGRAWQTWMYEEGTGRLAQFYFDKDTVGEPTGTNYGIAALSYRYDAAGNILSITDDPVHTSGDLDPETQCFQYDHLRRLTEAWAQAGTGACAAVPSGGVVGGPGAYWSTYRYDKTGNRLSETTWNPAGRTEQKYAYPAAGGDAPHAATSVTGGDTSTGFTYDAAGFTKTATRDGQTDAYTWTPTGRLETVVGTEGTTRFYDDAAGQRVMRVDPDGDMTAWVAGHELNYSAATGTVKATRFYQHSGVTVGARVDRGDIEWFATDQHGTNQWIVNGDKLTAKVRRYDPFGNVRSASAAAEAAWPGQQGYVGGITNEGVGLTTVGAREYDPATGRFMSVDPIGAYTNPQQLNGYSYASNNPVTKADPSGLYETECQASSTGCKSGPGASSSGGGGQSSGGGGGEGEDTDYSEDDYTAALLWSACAVYPEDGHCETMDSQYTTPTDQGIVMIDLYIAAEWFMPPIFQGHGNNRGHETSPWAESKVKVFWDTASGQITTVVWPTCVGDECHTAVDLCFGCGEGNSVDVSDWTRYANQSDPVRPWTTEESPGWAGVSFTIDAVNSVIPVGPAINRTVSVGFDGSSSAVNDSGDSFPSLTVVQITRDGETNVLAEMDELDADLGIFWLSPDANTLSHVYSWEDGDMVAGS